MTGGRRAPSSPLTVTTGVSNLDPSWSPDGETIAFTRNGQIFTSWPATARTS